MDWFLYDNGLRHERVKQHLSNIGSLVNKKVKQNWDWVEKKYPLSNSYVSKRKLVKRF